jgi:hypothetical protein
MFKSKGRMNASSKTKTSEKNNTVITVSSSDILEIKAKVHKVQFGITDASDKDDIKSNNIIIKNLDYRKFNKVEFKIGTNYSNDFVDTVTIKNKYLKYFFKDVRKKLHNPNNVITILPIKNKPDFYYLDINDIQLYFNKNITVCEAHFHFKKKISYAEFFKFI